MNGPIRGEEFTHRSHVYSTLCQQSSLHVLANTLIQIIGDYSMINTDVLFINEESVEMTRPFIDTLLEFPVDDHSFMSGTTRIFRGLASYHVRSNELLHTTTWRIWFDHVINCHPALWNGKHLKIAGTTFKQLSRNRKKVLNSIRNTNQQKAAEITERYAFPILPKTDYWLFRLEMLKGPINIDVISGMWTALNETNRTRFKLMAAVERKSFNENLVQWRGRMIQLQQDVAEWNQSWCNHRLKKTPVVNKNRFKNKKNNKKVNKKIRKSFCRLKYASYSNNHHRSGDCCYNHLHPHVCYCHSDCFVRDNIGRFFSVVLPLRRKC